MRPYLIGIAGPSGAGKSLFCKVMTATFEGVSRLKFDDFFKDFADVKRTKDGIRKAVRIAKIIFKVDNLLAQFNAPTEMQQEPWLGKGW